MTAVMFESKNMKMVWIIAVVNRIWEPRHQVATHATIDDPPTRRAFKYGRNRPFRFIEKLNSGLKHGFRSIERLR